jgi:hypothetical protein
MPFHTQTKLPVFNFNSSPTLVQLDYPERDGDNLDVVFGMGNTKGTNICNEVGECYLCAIIFVTIHIYPYFVCEHGNSLGD